MYLGPLNKALVPDCFIVTIPGNLGTVDKAMAIVKATITFCEERCRVVVKMKMPFIASEAIKVTIWGIPCEYAPFCHVDTVERNNLTDALADLHTDL